MPCYYKKYYLFYLILFLFSFLPSGEINAKGIIKQLSNLNGLSNNSVNCIMEDSDRQLWIGTWDGLNVYNGRDIVSFRYNKNDKNSISNNVIRQIIEQDKSRLWISTDYGINLWDKKKQGFEKYFFESEHVPKQEKSFLIAISNQKQVFSYVKGEGFYYFDENTKTFKPFNKTNLQGVNCNITSMVVNQSDYLYMLCEDGSLMYTQIIAKNNELQMKGINRYPLPFKTEHLFYNEGKLVVSGEGYMTIIGESSSETILSDSGMTPNNVTVRNNILYYTVPDKGCFAYNLSDKSRYGIEGLPDKVLYFSLYVGTQDILWIGTDGQGVYQCYNYERPFKNIKTNYAVRCFVENNEGNILFGTKGEGVNILEKETGANRLLLSENMGLISNSVYSLQKNKAGDIFIGTEGEGLNIYMQATNRLKKLKILPSHFSFRSVYCLFFTDNDSVLWVGTSGYGLIKLCLQIQNGEYIATDYKQFRASSQRGSLNNDIIFSIQKGRDDNELLIGTRGGGVNRFNMVTNNFELMKNAYNIDLSNNDILSMLHKGNKLYIGTSYGLNYLEPSSGDINYKLFTETEGLLNSTIHGILIDTNNDVWVSTNNGISHIKTGEVINYTYKDGLQSNEFSDGAFYSDSKGILYFGGINGFNYFTPTNINFRDYEPELRLSGLKIYNTQRNSDEMITGNVLRLPYNDRFVTLSFIASDFINNENCEYAYRLLNFSDEWIYNGDNPNIVFTKLPPGKYTLEVKCTNGDKIWSNNVFTLTIDVANPWWFSSYAIIVYIMLSAIAFYVARSIILNRIRLNRQIMLEHIEKQHQQQIHESRLNFFTNVAHEFFTPLTLIYSPAQHLLDNVRIDKYTKRYILQIKNNAVRMQKLIQELMEFRKAESGHTSLHPEHIDIKLLLDYIVDNYNDIKEQNHIDFTIGYSGKVENIYSDRISLERILFNLISNAFKYTPKGGYIKVEIAQDKNNSFIMAIQNSGKGLTDTQIGELFNRFKIFDTTQLQNATSTGIGLSLVKSLIELLKGNIKASSILGEYVRFEVFIPPLEIVDTQEEETGTEDKNAQKENVSISASERKNDINILIVEDENNIRSLLKEIISPFYNIFEAENGKDALEKVKQNIPDIIVSDIMMPEMDGISFITALKSDPVLAHIPVIGVSAKNSIEDQTVAYKHGIDLFISKPFHPKHILATIESTLLRINKLKMYFGSSISSTTIKKGVTMYQEDEKLLTEIILYIEKNIMDENLSPNNIAEAFGLSKATLFRKLKDLANASPSEFVREIRLKHAEKLLISTNLTVMEVMFQSGFSNKSYFYREFAKLYNFSPKAYREEKRKNDLQ